ncbi:hypothetical protein ACJX0J_035827, partial [Zea mays]
QGDFQPVRILLIIILGRRVGGPSPSGRRNAILFLWMQSLWWILLKGLVNMRTSICRAF